jgi:hypothetical protein
MAQNGISSAASIGVDSTVGSLSMAVI